MYVKKYVLWHETFFFDVFDQIHNFIRADVYEALGAKAPGLLVDATAH